MASEMAKAKAKLREFALSLPGAHEDFPWGERVIKVGKKVFVFLGKEEGENAGGVSVKLPVSGTMALALPFTEPTGYGLGKSGWVSASFPRGQRLPIDLLREWIEESYRAVAPKKLVAKLDGPSSAEKTASAPLRKRTTKRTSSASKH
jgi:predicted DNA-binding protein (MmcQ/YjbR family)